MVRTFKNASLGRFRLFLVAAVLAPTLAFAATTTGALLEVRLGSDETIRDVAQRYLKDADLWPQVLELSGYESITDLAPGATLKLPVAQVERADGALAESLTSIQVATAEGAQLFAPLEIGTAIALRDEALLHRKQGAWDITATTAETATGHAKQAYKISRAQRDKKVEALLSDAQGAVEGRRPEQSRWSSRIRDDSLVEFERVRTRSASTAQITFRDLSRLRLSPNSNALIDRMRADPLTRTEEAKITLLDGDFYALLGDVNERSRFDVEVPGIVTEVTSKDFWISHNADASRFANYDTGTLKVEAGGQMIDIGKNEGAVVPRDGSGAVEVAVLTGFRLVAPLDEAVAFNGSVEFSWDPVEDAAGYWLELATDADFNVMIETDERQPSWPPTSTKMAGGPRRREGVARP